MPTDTHPDSIESSIVTEFSPSYCLQQRNIVLPPSFGLSWNNYIGALPQSNTPSPKWTDFFIQQRLDPQVWLAAEKGLPAPAALRSSERL